jgi:hypothetical protein
MNISVTGVDFHLSIVDKSATKSHYYIPNIGVAVEDTYKTVAGVRRD